MPRRFRRRYSYETPTDGTPDVAPESVDLAAAEDGADDYCGRCSFFSPGELGDAGACVIVEGDVRPEQVCSLFVRRAEPTALELPAPPTMEEEMPVVEDMPEEMPVVVAALAPLIASGGYMIGEGLPDGLAEGETLGDMHTVAMTRVCVLIREDEVSADGRFIDAGALTWREPPLTLTINHDPDQRPAILTHIARATDLGALEALAAAAVAEGRDITPEEFAAATGDTGPYVVARVEFDEMWLGEDTAREVEVGLLRGVSVEIGDEVADYLETPDGDAVYVVHAGRIGAASLTPFGAIESARVIVPGDAEAAMDEAEVIETPGVESVAASAGPLAPPASWFTDPGLDGPTPITVTADGQVFGHLATWGTCHVGRPGVCLEPPRSATGYSYFAKPGAVLCDDGTLVAAGLITLGTGHAPASRGVTAQAAADHYDHTGTVVADVASGEDEHGIWLAGRMRPDVDDLTVQQFRASKFSGDWRPVPEGLELVAALAVNVPGFPVRPHAVVASGQQVALFAGIEPEHGCGCGSSDVADRLRHVEAIIAALGLDSAAVDAIAASIAPPGESGPHLVTVNAAVPAGVMIEEIAQRIAVAPRGTRNA